VDRRWVNTPVVLRTYVPVVSVFVFVTLLLPKTLLAVTLLPSVLPMLPVTLLLPMPLPLLAVTLLPPVRLLSLSLCKFCAKLCVPGEVVGE
jgi:hypothetical protein